MKRKNTLLFISLFFTFLYNYTCAQLVTTNSELQNAISNASTGTTITLATGTWTDVEISINKTGTITNPITIEAENSGQVFFEGNSSVSMGGSYIIFKDVIFQNASGLVTSSNRIDPIIEFRTSSSNECNNCTVTNIKIDSYNGTASQKSDTFKWIIVYGQQNEISYSSFLGKHGIGSIINDNRNENTSGSNFSEPDFTKIHHNYFADRTPIREVNQDNDQDAIRIGQSKTSLHPSNTEVYDNLFYNWSGEVEIISNKSGENKYYNNTFKNYQGTLTLRHGDDCEVYNNHFFADNRQFSGGVRVIGVGHKIYNNYIEGVNSEKPTGGTTKTAGAINVSNGRLNSALNGYFQVIDATIINNTFVNCDYGFRIGTNVGNNLTLAPENLTIANNIMINTSKNAVDEQKAPIGTSIYQGNITQNGNWDLTDGVDNNQTVASGLLVSGTDFYRLATGSAAIDAGIGTYSFLTKDILDGSRPSNYDAGAEEFGANGTRLPYTINDVGKKLGFGAPEFILDVQENSLSNKGLLLYPIPAKNQDLNIQSQNTPIGLVEIYDLRGRVIYTKQINDTNGLIETDHFSAGTYIAKIQGAYGHFVIQ